jgi:hypothetical protein
MYYAVPTNRVRADRLLKKLVTFRLDPELLAKAKSTAELENRTLTNFVETVLKIAVEGNLSRGEQTTAPVKAGRPPRQGVHRTGAED